MKISSEQPPQKDGSEFIFKKFQHDAKIYHDIVEQLIMFFDLFKESEGKIYNTWMYYVERSALRPD
jgi:hypothetical protein